MATSVSGTTLSHHTHTTHMGQGTRCSTTPGLLGLDGLDDLSGGMNGNNFCRATAYTSLCCGKRAQGTALRVPNNALGMPFWRPAALTCILRRYHQPPPSTACLRHAPTITLYFSERLPNLAFAVWRSRIGRLRAYALGLLPVGHALPTARLSPVNLPRHVTRHACLLRNAAGGVVAFSRILV